MKKIYPWIVILITLSVVGILFIQMSWIQNAIKLKHEEFQRSVELTLNETKEGIHSKFVYKTSEYVPTEESKRYILSRFFMVEGKFTAEEISDIIAKRLKENNVKQKFEFCVTNIYKNIILQSPGFHPTEQETAYRIELTPEDSYRARETLYISIREDKNLIIREMGWMVVASSIYTTRIVLAFALTVRTLINQK